MCIVHKGFRGFRAVSHASILGGILIGLAPAIPYDTIPQSVGGHYKRDTDTKSNIIRNENNRIIYNSIRTDFE